MNTITTNFTEIKIQRTKSGKCISCGKHRRRSKTFWQIRNPYNKNPDGTMKTSSDIRKELYRDALQWDKESIDCCN